MLTRRFHVTMLLAGLAASPILLLAAEETPKRSDTTDVVAELTRHVKALEARVKELERAQVELQQQLKQQPAIDFGRPKQLREDSLDFPSNAVRVPSAAQGPNGQPIPKNWAPQEFNGMTYYLVPLATSSDRP